MTTPHAFASAVAAMGGSVSSGDRATAPGPGHSRRDRSLSLRLTSCGRVLVHSFANDPWADVAAHLARFGLEVGAPSETAPTGASSAQSRVRSNGDVARRIKRARALLAASKPIRGTLAERYLRDARAISALPDGSALGYLADAPLSPYAPASDRVAPALVAAVVDTDGVVTGASLTFLRRDGLAKRARPRGGRLFVGQVRGGVVRLAAIDETMVVGEGLETTLSAMEVSGLAGLAALSAHGVRGLRPPAGVRRVVIAVDRDDTGEAATQALAQRLLRAGLRVEFMRPPSRFNDMNDALRAMKAEDLS